MPGAFYNCAHLSSWLVSRFEDVRLVVTRLGAHIWAMPPWDNIEPLSRQCVVCSEKFSAKRSSAKYCSTICQSRARPKRRYDPIATKRRRQKRLAQPGYRERINQQTNERIRAIRIWLSGYKRSVGCVDCGFADPRALDFDHIGTNKAFNVCNAKSIAQAKREIRKCVVRCANCHRIKTWDRLQQSRK